jgi:hypothetical protein
MEDGLLVPVVVIAAATLFAAQAYVTSWMARRSLKWTFDALASAKCPKCKHVIGPSEAQRASDRSDKLIAQHLASSVDVGGEGHWPVICPGCAEKLVYWHASRSVHTAKQLIADGWLKPYDLNYFEGEDVA